MERVNEVFELLEVLQYGSGVADVQRVRAQMIGALHELLRYMAREDPRSVVLAYLERRTRYAWSQSFTTGEVARFTGLSSVVVGRVLHCLERAGVVQRGRLRGEWQCRRESIRALPSREAVHDVQDAVDLAAHGVQDGGDPARRDVQDVADPEECRVDEQDMVDVQDGGDPVADAVQDAVDPVVHGVQDVVDPADVPIEVEDVNWRWQAFVERLKTASPAAWRCLAGSYLEIGKGAVCLYLRSPMALAYIRASEQRKESVKMAVRKVLDMASARVVFRVQDGGDLAEHGVQDGGDLAHRDVQDVRDPEVDPVQDAMDPAVHGVQDSCDPARCDHALGKAVLALTLDQTIEVYRELFARWAQVYANVDCPLCRRIRDWVSVVPRDVREVEWVQSRVRGWLGNRSEESVEEYPPPKGEYSERQMAWLRCVLGFIDTRGSASVMKLVSQLRVEKLCRVDEWQEAERFIRYVASVGECGLRLNGEIVSRVKVK